MLTKTVWKTLRVNAPFGLKNLIEANIFLSSLIDSSVEKMADAENNCNIVMGTCHDTIFV